MTRAKADVKRWRWPGLGRVSLGIVFALLAAYTALDLLGTQPTVGYFKSVEGQAQYWEAYRQAMEAMPPVTAVHDIRTSWGIVRVYEWRNEENRSRPPIVLLPGHSSGAPMWQSNLVGFSKEHTVYAIDALGDAGGSLQQVPLTSMDDVTSWMSETLTELGIERAHIVGHSFGGGYAADFARRHPEQVQTLTLLEPAFALNDPSPSVLFWATVGSLEFLPETWRQYGLAQVSGEAVEDLASDDPLTRMISAASANYATSLPTPTTLTAEELKSLPMPVYVALADHSPITSNGAAEAASLIPHATVRVWAHTTHSLPMQVADDLSSELTQFWRKGE